MVENQVQNPPAEKVIALSASLLEPFQGHPFRVASGEEMEQLKENIREYGVLSPLLVRPRGDGRYMSVLQILQWGPEQMWHRQWNICVYGRKIILYG